LYELVGSILIVKHQCMVTKYLKFRKLSTKSSYIKLGCDLYTRVTYTHTKYGTLANYNEKCTLSVLTRNIKSCQIDNVIR